MLVAVTHFYMNGPDGQPDAWSDIIETDRLPTDLRLQVEQAVLVQLKRLPLPGDVMQNEIFNAGGENQYPMMIMGKLTIVEQ